MKWWEKLFESDAASILKKELETAVHPRVRREEPESIEEAKARRYLGISPEKWARMSEESRRKLTSAVEKNRAEAALQEVEKQKKREIEQKRIQTEQLENDPEYRATCKGLAPPSSCNYCKNDRWEFVESSPNELAAKWKCTFCGKVRMVVADDDTDEPSDAERSSRYISKSVRLEVWRRDEAKCVNCGSNELLEFDHIIPVAKGGSNTARNVQLLCENCNRSKRDKIQ